MGFSDAPVGCLDVDESEQPRVATSNVRIFGPVVSLLATPNSTLRQR